MSDRRAEDLILQVIGYHQATKHHFYRYARGPGYMDWANQPNPFRRYEGSRLFHLPLLRPNDAPISPPYEALFHRHQVPVQPVTLPTLSRFLEYALAVSAWKEAGGVRWALRSNPSSGNLHPTEGYLLLREVSGLSAGSGLYHYAPKEHALERRADWPDDLFSAAMQTFPRDAFLLGLSSIHWREAWKYGERAFRYCQHDAGHAIGSARLAAAALGWNLIVLDDLADDEIVALLGLGRDTDYARAEREHPDCLAVVWPDRPPEHTSLPLALPDGIMEQAERVAWHGAANRLSRDQVDAWDIIDVVSAASKKPRTHSCTVEVPYSDPASNLPTLALVEETNHPSAGDIIRQRRSAVSFDGKTSISAKRFFHMLSRVMPHADTTFPDRPVPWDAIPWAPSVHLALFVHRVDGLSQGLYVLARDRNAMGSLREAMHGHFLWTQPPGCPKDLPLYLLLEGDAKQLAVQVSCHQDIAGDSAFALGMIAEFEPTIRRHGAWYYRRLFWETGVVGQVLYLEAEAAGIRATGIGCFFDDPMHQAFGLQETRFQSLYHFTMGGPVEDARLTTLPAYEPRAERSD